MCTDSLPYQGTITIQGILVDFPEGDMVHLSSKAFKNMKMLRLLIVNPSACFSRGPIFLPNELIVLDWPNCPLESFPSNFHGAKLVVLRMPGSLVKELKGVEVQLLFLGKLRHHPTVLLPFYFGFFWALRPSFPVC